MTQEVPNINLPKNPVDKQKVADKTGVVYEYDAKSDSWINIGVIPSPPMVSKDIDGLITPEIFRKLQLLKTLANNNINFGSFQIATNNDNGKPYFYHFTSSDGLIKFIPESPTKLRIELDRAKLYAKVLRNCCVGPKGDKGPAGDVGRDGKPAKDEEEHIPEISDDGLIRFSAKVSTPIDTEISTRFFNEDDEQIAEILLSLDGDVMLATSENIEVADSEFEIDYDKETEMLVGSLRFLNIETGGTSSDITDGLYFKSRQKGPKGPRGKDGTGFLEIIEDIFGDDTVQSPEAIITIRKSGVSNNIAFTKKELFTKNVVASITGSPDLPVGDLEEAEFIGLQATTDDCKDIGKFVFPGTKVEAAALDLPSWTPACNCTDTFRYQISRFDWASRSAIDVPFSIVQEAPGDEACCAENFYWCPNVGDQCGISGSPKAPIRLPVKSKFFSDDDGGSSGVSGGSSGTTKPIFKDGFVPCNLPDNYIYEHQGNGVNLGSFNEDGQIVAESIVTNRGKPDVYTLDVDFDNANTTFQIDVEIQIGSSNGTFNGSTAFSPAQIEKEENPPIEIPELQEKAECPCPIHTTMVLETIGGSVTNLVPGIIQDAQHDAIQNGYNTIEKKTFTGITVGDGASMQLTVNANDTLLDCCLPYAIRITVSSKVIEDVVEATGTGDATGINGDGDDDIGGPPSDTPAIDNPIEPSPEPPMPEPQFNNPDFDGAAFFVNENGDLPIDPDRPYLPSIAKPPILIGLNDKIDGMYISETIRSIEINSRPLNTIKIDILQHAGDRDINNMLIPHEAQESARGDLTIIPNKSLVFERNGIFIENGPFGTGFYFLQVEPFTITSRLAKFKLTARTDKFTEGFMYISAESFEDEGPSSVAIISYATEFTVNDFANTISGFGSKWIQKVNKGVQIAGDAIFQLTMDSSGSIIREIFQDKVTTFDGTYIDIIYDPHGCATIDVPEVVNSMVGDVVGGRDDPACIPLEPPIEREIVQKTTVEFVETSSTAKESDGTIDIEMVVSTDDGLPLESSLIYVFEDTGLGTAIDGVNYSVGSPDTIMIPAGTESGTTISKTVTVFGTPSDSTVIFILKDANGGEIGDKSLHTLTIESIQVIEIGFDSSTSFLDNSAPTNGVVTIVVTTQDGNVTDRDSQINVVDTLTGSGAPGEDYTFSDGTGVDVVEFQAGTPSGTVIEVQIDSLGSEAEANVILEVSSPIGANTGPITSHTVNLFTPGA